MESGLVVVVLLATMALTLGLLISLLTATEALTLGLVMEEVLRVLPLRPIQSLLRFSTSPMSTWQREL